MVSQKQKTKIFQRSKKLDKLMYEIYDLHEEIDRLGSSMNHITEYIYPDYVLSIYDMNDILKVLEASIIDAREKNLSIFIVDILDNEESGLFIGTENDIALKFKSVISDFKKIIIELEKNIAEEEKAQEIQDIERLEKDIKRLTKELEIKKKDYNCKIVNLVGK